MGRLNRVLEVLEAFADGSSVLSAEQICARTNNPPATGYRHIRDLCEAGLLVRLPHGYTPGPRIIEGDYMVRSNDPLLQASREPAEQLVADTGLELLLSQLYGERIVNVHYLHSEANPLLALGQAIDQVGRAKFKAQFHNLKHNPQIRIPARPLELLSFLMKDLTLSEAAEILQISISTANQHIALAKKAFNTSTIHGALLCAIKEGLLEL